MLPFFRFRGGRFFGYQRNHAKPNIKSNAAANKPDDSDKQELLATDIPDAGNTLREQAVEAWEELVEDVIAYRNVPVGAHAAQLKLAFGRLCKDDQMDCIRHALNLLPDEQFAALYDILYDKNEDPEVLDAIFSDALNRTEQIKVPLLKFLRKDPDHPMFFESSRILDVIDTEEEKEESKPSP